MTNTPTPLGNPRLILMVGLPRSGKSTWARQQGVPIVNPDAIRLALHGKAYEALAEPFVWAIAKIMVRALFLAGARVVVLDATNTTQARRDEWKSEAWLRYYVYIPTPVAVCIARAIAGDRRDLVPVIERMATTYEHPDSVMESLPEWNIWEHLQ